MDPAGGRPHPAVDLAGCGSDRRVRPDKLIENGLLPPELIYQHPDYLRPAHGITIPGAHQLFFHAVDVCRAATASSRRWGIGRRRPSGAGYAMADRRVVSRVLPDLFRRSAPRGLGAFFHTMRSALASVAPNEAEDPRVVVLTPGTHSETAFDQAMLASLLGVPLVESADLTIRRGRLWMRSMGRFEPVDVVVRRVDAVWSDPLDLQARLPAGGRRAGGGLPSGDRHGGEHPGQRRAGKPRPGALPAAAGPGGARGER